MSKMKYEWESHRENKEPPYTLPPQWQGLTEDEIDIIWKNNHYDNFELDIEFARAIEQALKENNTI